MNLTEFLLARIAEDEVVAREALDRPGGDAWFDSVVYDDGVRNPAVAVAPAHVLAECEAKRRIVGLHRTIRAAYPNTTIETDPCCEECSAGGEYPGGFPCLTLRLLALPYADHPDYDPAWRP